MTLPTPPGSNQTRFARRGFARLAYEASSGEPTAPPVMLLHDLLAARLSLAPWRAALIAAGASVIVPDLRGHGASAAIPGVRFTMAELVLDALAVIDDAGAPVIGVLGVGLGAAIGLDLARVAPERVRRLVLVDPLLPSSFRDDPEFAALREEAAAIADLANRGGVDRAFDRYFGPGWRERRSAPVIAAMRRHSSAFGTLLTAAFTYLPDLTSLRAPGLITHPGDTDPRVVAALLAAGAVPLGVESNAETDEATIAAAYLVN